MTCVAWLAMFQLVRGAIEKMQGRRTAAVSKGSLDGHLSYMLNLLQNLNGQVVEQVELHITPEKETNPTVNGGVIRPAVDPLSSLLYRPSLTPKP